MQQLVNELKIYSTEKRPAISLKNQITVLIWTMKQLRQVMSMLITLINKSQFSYIDISQTQLIDLL